jgi:hypothetical protein
MEVFMLKLFEIDKEMVSLNELMEQWAMEHEGDITDFPLFDELDKLERDLTTKALAIAAIIKCYEAEAVGVKSVLDDQKKRLQHLNNKVDRLKSYLQSHVPAGQKMQDGRSTISWRSSSYVDVSVLPTELPAKYQRRVEEITADKKAIGDDLKAGVEIRGAEWKTKQNIQIK